MSSVLNVIQSFRNHDLPDVDVIPLFMKMLTSLIHENQTAGKVLSESRPLDEMPLSDPIDQDSLAAVFSSSPDHHRSLMKLKFLFDVLFVCLDYTPAVQFIFFSSPYLPQFSTTLMNLTSLLDFSEMTLPIWSIILRLLPGVFVAAKYDLLSSHGVTRANADSDNEEFVHQCVEIFRRVIRSSDGVTQPLREDLEIALMKILIFFELSAVSFNQRISSSKTDFPLIL